MSKIDAESIAAARNALGVPPERLPRSAAIIMDGNGRWARARKLPRVAGHSEGAKNVPRIIARAAELGLDALALYSFSSENWRRPPEEVQALMHLYADYLVRERPTLMANNVRLRHLGRRDRLPQFVLDEIDESVRVSASNTGMWLALAIDYGGRDEILRGVRRLARRAADGELEPDAIDEATLSAAVDTAGLPDPDLLIRTAGEMRISNFLLWQLSYAEFYVTDVHWPDFHEAQFEKALRAYANRHRRFGAVDDSNA